METLKELITVLIVFLPIFVSSQEVITTSQIENYDGDAYVLENVLEEEKYVVNIYADWCGWCKLEWQEWSECIEQYKVDYNLEFLVLAADKEIENVEEKDKILNSLSNYVDLNELSIYFINQDSLTQIHGITAFPTSFIIDEFGEVLDTLKGYHNCDGLEEELNKSFGIPTDTNEISNEHKTKIYYANDQLYIETSYAEKYNINIFSIKGEMIRHVPNLNGNSEISLTGLNYLTIVVSLSADNEIINSQLLTLVR